MASVLLVWMKQCLLALIVVSSVMLSGVSLASDSTPADAASEATISSFLMQNEPTGIRDVDRLHRSDFDHFWGYQLLDRGHHLINKGKGFESVVYQNSGVQRVFYPDMFSFQVLSGDLEEYFSLDKYYLYFQGIPVQLSVPGLQRVDRRDPRFSEAGVVWKTDLGVFFNDIELGMADSATFRWLPGYGDLAFVDKNYVYYWGAGKYEGPPQECGSRCFEHVIRSHNGYLLAIPKDNMKPINDWLFALQGEVVDANLRPVRNINELRAVRKISKDFAYDDRALFHGTDLVPLTQKNVQAARLSQLKGDRVEPKEDNHAASSGCYTISGHYLGKGHYMGEMRCYGHNLWLDLEGGKCAGLKVEEKDLQTLSYSFAVDKHRVFYVDKEAECPLHVLPKAKPKDFQALDAGDFGVSSKYLYYRDRYVLENSGVLEAKGSLEYLAAYRAYRSRCSRDTTPWMNAYLFRNNDGYWLFVTSFEDLRRLYLGTRPNLDVFPFLDLEFPSASGRSAGESKLYDARIKLTNLDECYYPTPGHCRITTVAVESCRDQGMRKRAGLN